jgi:4-amino-4-deoxy-L-arabinose transferase-like glycosyltransferase
LWFNLKRVLTERLDIIILLIFFLTVFLTRIPFTSKFLYQLDSVNYALAFQHFNINLSQPQAPGYIFFVALGKFINIFFNNPNTSMIFISIVFSILTVFLVYLLVKQMFSREIAVVASILLIFNPIFWFYGEIAMIYMSEALFATLIAYTSYKLLKGDDKFLYLSSIALGLSGGFRQDLIVFMFPLWLFSIYYQNFDYKKIFKAFMLLIASTLLWFIPTIMLTGGLWKYLQLDHSQLVVGAIQLNSIFFGATMINQLTMDNELLSWTILGIGFFSIIILLFFTFFNLKRVFILSNFKNSKIENFDLLLI